MRECGGTTRSGRPCRRPVTDGECYCYQHGGGYGGVLSGTRRRRLERTDDGSGEEDAAGRAAALAGALPIDTRRLERALRQRIYLLDRPGRHKFAVMGNSGTAYVVMLAADDDAGTSAGVMGTSAGAGTSAARGATGYHVHPTSRAWGEVFPSCTCPDFAGRRILCKHILFVLVKILHLAPPITRDMLDEACERGPAPRQHAAAAPRFLGPRAVVAPRRRPTSSFATHARAADDDSDVDELAQGLRELTTAAACQAAACQAKPVEAGEECPVCYEAMAAGGGGGGVEALVFCAAECGRHFHADCLERLAQHCSRAGLPLQCPLCRAPWRAVSSAAFS
jgi:hypothetical protein